MPPSERQRDDSCDKSLATAVQSVSKNLDAEIEERFKDRSSDDRERAARRISLTMQGIGRHLRLDGEVRNFGSFSNGFRVDGSDLDVVFLGHVKEVGGAVAVLQAFANELPMFGYTNVTRIFQAKIPLVKFTDAMSGMEVDLCVNNQLGLRNSKLLAAYCEYDARVYRLGRVVKTWAKARELVGTADGCLNSYAYMLLVIHFLQSIKPPVVPNLQELSTESVLILDHKWGKQEQWETKFVGDVKALPPSENTLTTGELLMAFFSFYGNTFDWQHNAVCVRLSGPDVHVDKSSLSAQSTEEQWYIEDPFDLCHNLGARCTRAGRTRIVEAMRASATILLDGGPLAVVSKVPGPEVLPAPFFLKCRISAGVSPEVFTAEFAPFGLGCLHFRWPDSGGRNGQAFLEFWGAAARRQAHTRNEVIIAGCQLQLHYSTQYSLVEARSQDSGNEWSIIEVSRPRPAPGWTPARSPGAPSLQGQMSPSGQLGQRPPPPPPLDNPALPWHGQPQRVPGPPPGDGRVSVAAGPREAASGADTTTPAPSSRAAQPGGMSRYELLKTQLEASKRRPKASQMKEPLPREVLASASGASAAFPKSTAAQGDGGGCLAMRVVLDLPEGSGPLFSEPQWQQLEDVQGYLRRLEAASPATSAEAKGNPGGVFVDVEMRNDLPARYRLSLAQLDSMRDFYARPQRPVT